MFDIKWIRENPDTFDEGLRKRGLEPLSAKLVALDEQRRKTLASLQEAQSRRNAASKEIGKAKAAKDEERAQALMKEVADLKEVIQQGETNAKEIEARLNAELAQIPNLPLPDVPVGPDETANMEVRRVGTPPQFDFEPKQHFEIGEALGLMDFETAAKLGRAVRGAERRAGAARACRSVHARPAHDRVRLHGGQPTVARSRRCRIRNRQPAEVRGGSLQTTNGYWLILTAEVSLTNFVREEILTKRNSDPPTAWTPCFRSEAGAAGKTRAA